MRFEKTIHIDAPVDVVRDVVMDVGSWPRLTESVSTVELLDPGPLKVGSRVRIKQPRLPRTDWTVTEVSEAGFTYEAKGPGVRTVARHEVTASGPGTVLRLVLDQAGPVGLLIGRLGAGMTRRYLELEANGMKSGAEQAAAGGTGS